MSVQESNVNTDRTIVITNVDAPVDDNKDVPVRHNYEVVFYAKYYPSYPRPSEDEIAKYFSRYGDVHHVKCPENRDFAFVFVTKLSTSDEYRRTRTTITQIIREMIPEKRFRVNVASSNRPRYNTRHQDQPQRYNRHPRSQYRDNRNYQNNDYNFRGRRNMEPNREHRQYGRSMEPVRDQHQYDGQLPDNGVIYRRSAPPRNFRRFDNNHEYDRNQPQKRYVIKRHPNTHVVENTPVRNVREPQQRELQQRVVENTPDRNVREPQQREPQQLVVENTPVRNVREPQQRELQQAV